MTPNRREERLVGFAWQRVLLKLVFRNRLLRQQVVELIGFLPISSVDSPLAKYFYRSAKSANVFEPHERLFEFRARRMADARHRRGTSIGNSTAQTADQSNSSVDVSLFSPHS